MTEGRWKLVVDGHGVTIANDRFRFTTTAPAPDGELPTDDTVIEAVESGQLETLVAELQSMTKRNYGQFCGLSRAIELIGERWMLLIVRDLLVGPKTVAELQRGLPRIPAGILRVRLEELRRAGVVRNGVLPRADGSVVYELTEWGEELEEIALRLGRWGTKLLDRPRPEDVVTVDSLVMALRSTFRPEAARGLRVGYELRVGDIVFHALVDNGVVEVAEGRPPGADLVIEPGDALRGLLSGEVDPTAAVEDGSVRITGDPALLTRFVEVFQIPRRSAAAA